MNKLLLGAILNLIFLSTTFAHPVVGYFEAKATSGGAKNRMCVTELPDKRLDIYIATSYCPSKECYNARIDNLNFQSRLRANNVLYKDAQSCLVKVQFDKGGAQVHQSAQCVTDDHPYLEASGYYKFVKAEVSDSDCGP